MGSFVLGLVFFSTGTPDLVDFNWDDLGFQLIPTDFMYLMSCSSDGVFMNGKLVPYGSIELNPAAAVLNYGQVWELCISVRVPWSFFNIVLICSNVLIKLPQGLLEGLRSHRKEDGSILLFRPHENARRMEIGADRLCMPAPSVEQFLEAVKLTVLANKHWVRALHTSCWICDASLMSHPPCSALQVPPFGKGSLYIRPQLIGSGAMLGVAPAPQYTFIVFVCPVGHYFKVNDLTLFLFCLQLVLYFTRSVRTVLFTFRVV
jgi:branched-chain amino acid aminotransferase